MGSGSTWLREVFGMSDVRPRPGDRLLVTACVIFGVYLGHLAGTKLSEMQVEKWRKEALAQAQAQAQAETSGSNKKE